jgi:hypothetical protein
VLKIHSRFDTGCSFLEDANAVWVGDAVMPRAAAMIRESWFDAKVLDTLRLAPRNR